MKTLLTLVIITASSAALYAVWKPSKVQAQPKAIHYVEESEPPQLGRVPTESPFPDTKVTRKPAKGRMEILDCIGLHESNGRYDAVSPGGRYLGKYQFTRSSFLANFGTLDPSQVSPERQDALAWDYYQRRGLQPWPTPNRRCR